MVKLITISILECQISLYLLSKSTPSLLIKSRSIDLDASPFLNFAETGIASWKMHPKSVKPRPNPCVRVFPSPLMHVIVPGPPVLHSPHSKTRLLFFWLPHRAEMAIGLFDFPRRMGLFVWQQVGILLFASRGDSRSERQSDRSSSSTITALDKLQTFFGRKAMGTSMNNISILLSLLRLQPHVSSVAFMTFIRFEYTDPMSSKPEVGWTLISSGFLTQNADTVLGRCFLQAISFLF